MKRFAILLTLSILTFTRVRAQEMVTDYQVRPGQMIEDILPTDIQYLLPVFEKTAVTLQSGDEQTGRINIHTLTQKVHMLDEKGDTMMVAGQEDIIRIQTRDCTIIPADTCWVTVIAEHGGITLSSLASIELEYPDGYGNDKYNEELSGGNHLTWLTGAKTTVRYSRDGVPETRTRRYSPDETFTLRCIYKTEFVLTSEGRMYPCRLQSFLKLFRKRRNRSAGSPRPTTPTSTNWNPSCSCSTSAQESKNVSGHFHNGTISRYSLPLRKLVDFPLPHSFGKSSLSLHFPDSFQRSNGNKNHPARKTHNIPFYPFRRSRIFSNFSNSFGRSNVCPSSELARRTLTTS